MKNLAELKRSITVGTKLRAISHWQPNLVGTVRTVTKTQGNAYAFTAEGDKHMWMYYPKPSQIAFNGNQFTVTLDEKKSWTLEIIEAQS